MTETIPTTWNDERDSAFFGITEALAADGFADDTTVPATAVFARTNSAAQIETMLEELVVAESWESMATRSVARSNPRRRDLVPVPVAAPRRSAC